MTEVLTGTDADRALKAKHRAMWALGDYPTLASDLISELGPTIVEACGIGAGQRVLDIGRVGKRRHSRGPGRRERRGERSHPGAARRRPASR